MAAACGCGRFSGRVATANRAVRRAKTASSRLPSPAEARQELLDWSRFANPGRVQDLVKDVKFPVVTTS